MRGCLVLIPPPCQNRNSVGTGWLSSTCLLLITSDMADTSAKSDPNPHKKQLPVGQCVCKHGLSLQPGIPNWPSLSLTAVPVHGGGWVTWCKWWLVRRVRWVQLHGNSGALKLHLLQTLTLDVETNSGGARHLQHWRRPPCCTL